MFCSKCRTEMPREAKYCSSCGTAMDAPRSAPEPTPESAPGRKRISRGSILGLLLFVLITWAGSAGIAFGLFQSVEGPRGEQGQTGARGPIGPAGVAGSSQSDGSVRILAAFFAIDKLLATGDYGSSLSGSHPQVQACVDFIMDGDGSVTDCGFQRADQ